MNRYNFIQDIKPQDMTIEYMIYELEWTNAQILEHIYISGIVPSDMHENKRIQLEEWVKSKPANFTELTGAEREELMAKINAPTLTEDYISYE